MTSEFLVNTDTGSGLLSDSTKPIHEPMSTHHHCLWPSGIHFRVMFTWILKIAIKKLCLKFVHWKWQPYLPGDNELTVKVLWYLMRVQLCFWKMFPGQKKRIEDNLNSLRAENLKTKCPSHWGITLVQVLAVACSVWSHYMNQCWIIVSWTLRK